jgi:hypothetical protein
MTRCAWASCPSCANFATRWDGSQGSGVMVSPTRIRACLPKYPICSAWSSGHSLQPTEMLGDIHAAEKVVGTRVGDVSFLRDRFTSRQ